MSYQVWNPFTKSYEPSVRNNRNRKFASKSASKDSSQNFSLAPWEGGMNKNKFKTPHARHPDLQERIDQVQTRLIEHKKLSAAIPTDQKNIITDSNETGSPIWVGMRLKIGDKIAVWSDPDTGHVSVVSQHPAHYIEREAIVVGSTYETWKVNSAPVASNGTWFPIIYCPFKSEGSTYIQKYHILDSEILNQLHISVNSPQFNLLKEEGAYRFIAATRSPIKQPKLDYYSDLNHRSTDDRSLVDTDLSSYGDHESDDDVESPLGRCYSFFSPLEIDEDELYHDLDKLEGQDLAPLLEEAQSSNEEPTYQVKKIKIKPAQFKPNSITSHIFSLLLKCNRPLHQKEIVAKLDKKNLLDKAGYHKYSTVSSALRRNNLIFDQVDKATFSIRQGFKISNTKRLNKKAPTPKKSGSKSIASVKEIVINAAKECKTPTGVYPGLVYGFLMARNYNLSYSSVYRVMQTKLFKRNGFWYHLVFNK